MLRQRLQSGLLIAVALIAAAFWLPSWGVLLLLMIVCGVAMLEFYALLDAARIPHFKYVGFFGGLALTAATWWSSAGGAGGPSVGQSAVLFLVTAATFLRQFPQKNNDRPLETVSGTLLGVLYVAFMFNFFTKILVTWGDFGGRLFVLYLVFVVKLTDVGAYFIGCSIGRHKLIPRISPAKTWEGCLGGVFTGMAGSCFFWVLCGGNFGGADVRLLDAVLLGPLLAVLGTIGDLTESLFKRAAGVKDSGRIILGMGGLLDVLDSLLFAAPMLYLYGRLFFK